MFWGRIGDKATFNQLKGPLLGEIPVLGALFRSESRSRKKSNLMVFLRPVVMRDQAATDRVSLDRYDYIRAQQQQAQPPSNAIMQINDTPVLPPLRPSVSPASAPPRPLGDTSTAPPPPVPSAPAASAPN